MHLDVVIMQVMLTAVMGDIPALQLGDLAAHGGLCGDRGAAVGHGPDPFLFLFRSIPT